MSDDHDSELIRETRRLYRERQASGKPAAEAGSGGSPGGLERTLSSISDEVTAEAIERREHEAKLAARSRGPDQLPQSRTT